jgi:hypothetical protein
MPSILMLLVTMLGVLVLGVLARCSHGGCSYAESSSAECSNTEGSDAQGSYTECLHPSLIVLMRLEPSQLGYFEVHTLRAPGSSNLGPMLLNFFVRNLRIFVMS